MSIVNDSVNTEYTKTAQPSNQSTVSKAASGEVYDDRNDEPATDGQKESDDVTITFNGNTVVIVPKDQLRGMSEWVDSVNQYFKLKEGDSTTEKSDKNSAREQFMDSLSVLGNGVASSTVKISYDVAEYVANTWKEQAALAREARENPDSLKEKFNNILDSFKFDIPDKSDVLSVFNIGAFNDDDSVMRARNDVEVILSDTFESDQAPTRADAK